MRAFFKAFRACKFDDTLTENPRSEERTDLYRPSGRPGRVRYNDDSTRRISNSKRCFRVKSGALRFIVKGRGRDMVFRGAMPEGACGCWQGLDNGLVGTINVSVITSAMMMTTKRLGHLSRLYAHCQASYLPQKPPNNLRRPLIALLAASFIP